MMRLQLSKRRGGFTLGLVLAFILVFLFVLGLQARAGSAAGGDALSGKIAPKGALAGGLSATTPLIIQAEKSDLSAPVRSMATANTVPSGDIVEIPALRAPLTWHEDGVELDPVVQDAFGPGAIPSPIVNFDGMGNINGVLPPDTNGDVGPNHYVQMINLSFAIYDKSGTLLFGPVNTNTLWAGFGGPCQNDNSGDPIVVYDEAADRWILSQFAVSTGSHECIAVSQTPDPTGAYYRYAFNIGGFPDYPKLGVWENSYLATFRNFGAEFDMQAAAFNRTKMLAGDPTAEGVLFSISDAFTPLGVDGFLPADSDGAAPLPGTPALFMGTVSTEFGFDKDQIALFELDIDWANPGAATFTGPQLIETAPFDPLMCDGSRNCIPQPGTAQGLDAISDRPLFRLAYRDFGFYQVLLATQTVDVDGNDHAGKRWYELRDAGNGWGLYQQGTYAPDSEHRWMGSIAMDTAGNIALGYSVSSSTVYPSIRYTGRLATDPLGQMAQGEGEIIAGSGSQTSGAARWGDYSDMVVDPVDGCTFWYTTEYMPTTGNAPWQTRIASFKFPECPDGLAPDFALWPQPATAEACVPDSASFDLTAFSIGGYSDNVTLSASGVPAGYAASFAANPVVPSQNTTVTFSNTGAATAGSYDVTITGTGPASVQTTTLTLDLYTVVPDAPALLSPPDGAVNQPIRPTLEWAADANATGYFVEVATDAAFTNLVDSATVPGTSYKVSVNLDFDATYYWRVTPENVCGDGAASAAFSFTTIGDSVACPAGTQVVVAYDDDFDPTAPGWTHEAATGSDTWTLTAANPSPGSGANSWYSQDLPNPGDQRLVSPLISVPNQSEVYLEFWNEQNFENPAGSGGCWDGGLLEISTDGGANWTILDAELLTDPYDGFGNNGPPAGLPLWCGEANGIQIWTNSVVDVSGYAGQDVQFRFRNLSDAAAGAEGWYIDDVRVSYCEPLPEPGITVTKTVGTDPAVCAATSSIVVGQPNTDVTYCYTVENTGDVTLTTHTVVDDKLGTLLTDFAYDLGPGDTTFFTVTATITQSVTNVVTWTASVPGGPTATATATATVSEAPTSVTLSEFGNRAPVAPPGLWLPLLLVLLLSGAFVFWRRRLQA